MSETERMAFNLALFAFYFVAVANNTSRQCVTSGCQQYFTSEVFKRVKHV